LFKVCNIVDLSTVLLGYVNVEIFLRLGRVVSVVREKPIKTRYRLSKKDAKKLMEEVRTLLGDKVAELLLVYKSIERVETRLNFILYLFDRRPLLLQYGDKIFPTVLYAEMFKEALPLVVVDMGAVPHIINGADVMAPGIREVSKAFNEGATVLVVDEEKRRPFCVGVALMNSERIFSERRGRAIKNLHHVKDKIWDLLLRLR